MTEDTAIAAPEPEDETPAPPPILPTEEESLPAGPTEPNEPEAAVDDGGIFDSPEEAPDPEPEPPIDIDQTIEDAVGVSMQAFATRHPSTARVLRGRLRNPTEFVIESLKKDELYNQLVADTEKALSTAEIIKIIVPMAMRLAERFLIA